MPKSQFLIDAIFWDDVLKVACPACREFVQARKGRASSCFIKEKVTVKIDEMDVQIGMIARQIVRSDYLMKLSSVEARSPLGIHTRELEKLICRRAIKSGKLSSSTQYNGRFLLNQPDSSVDNTSAVSIGFVYLVRNGDLFKIGVTGDLLRRFNEIRPDEVLNVIRCCNHLDLEKKLHSHFAPKRIPQSEYFRLDSEELAEAHRLLVELANF